MWKLKQILTYAVLPLLMGAYCQSTQAERIPPADNHQVVNLTYDKSSPPADVYIWNLASGGYDTDDGPLWSRNTWHCLSDTAPDTGQCRTNYMWGYDAVVNNGLKLKFTEQRSRLSSVINLTGSRYILSNALYGPWRMESANYVQGSYEAKLSVWIPSAELARLPTGGIWKARLVLKELQWTPVRPPVATFSADITLNVTDRNNGAIYLPAFGSATPRVDLNLRTRPLSTSPGGEVSGQANIDMCLYDGYNSNSPWLKVTLSDLMSIPGRPSDIFSVTRDGTGGATAADRVDYRVAMTYNNQPRAMNNSQAMTLSGVNTALIRPVVLPGIAFPVVCTPAPLTLDVLPFAKLSKAAGHFSGTLRVTLAADALAP